MVNDERAAKEFLEIVAKKKLARKRRNLAAMVAKTTDPDKKTTDFIKVNVENFYYDGPER